MSEDVTEDRCPVTIRWGTTEECTTRCDKHHGHLVGDAAHEGPGLAIYPGQRIQWISGDRREYQGEWPGYCTLLGKPAFGGGCTLPAGHPRRCAP